MRPLPRTCDKSREKESRVRAEYGRDSLWTSSAVYWVGVGVHYSRITGVSAIPLLRISRKTPETDSEALPLAGPGASGNTGQPKARGVYSWPLSGSQRRSVLSSAHAAAENTLAWPGRG